MICRDRATADWAAGPFRQGWGGWTASSVHPLALGPDNVPPITDPEAARRDLALAAFSALIHSASPDAPAILDALARALGVAEEQTLNYYTDMLDIGLGNTPEREIWRKLMQNGTYFPGRGGIIEETFLKGKVEGEAKGEAKGLAEAVLRVLGHRHVEVPDEARERILGCRDSFMLGRWLDEALSIESVGELFEED